MYMSNKAVKRSTSITHVFLLRNGSSPAQFPSVTKFLPVHNQRNYSSIKISTCASSSKRYRAQTNYKFALVNTRNFGWFTKDPEPPKPVTEHSGDSAPSLPDAAAADGFKMPDVAGDLPEGTSDAVVEAAVVAADALMANRGYASGMVMDAIENLHVMSGLPYWEVIVLITLGVRFMLLPVAIKTVSNSARMAALRPDMEKVKEMMEKDPTKNDPGTLQKYQNQMRGLFTKHKVNPFHAVMMPLFQLPIFMTFFFALREMGNYYPALATGGAFWFVDLTAADPYYILPVLNSLSFVIMIEIGADGVQVEQQGMFKTVMRAVAVAMVPATMAMPQGLFVYWSTNNLFSILQTFALKQKALKRAFDIPDPPKQAPILKIGSPFRNLAATVEMEIKGGADVKAGGARPDQPPGPPPITFSTPPKRAGKNSKK